MGVRKITTEDPPDPSNSNVRAIRRITARLAPQDREDTEQEASLRLLDTASRQDVIRPVHLIRRIARNLVIDRLRHQSRFRPLENVAASGLLTCSRPDPEHALIDSQRLNRALSVIQSMPARRREAFLLHRIDGLSYAQIARRMAISPKAVEKHMTLAMIDLARGMEKLETPKVG